MTLDELLTPTHVLANAKASSRKQALEVLSQLLSKNQPDLLQADVMRSLVERERLGSTAIGGGAAVPHGRVVGIDRALAALIRLNEPVDYSAEDDMPVDLMFAMLVPEKCSDADAQLVAQATALLGQADMRQCMRTAKTSKELYACLTDHDADRASTGSRT